MKRIVTVQDISAIGKCSLTVALPIVSACGIETAVIPTAILSTHTAFSEFTFKDLTDEIEPITAHWKRENFKFDAIYTGYLGSFRQLELVSKMFDDFGKEAVKIVDPAMADNGQLYKGFTKEFALSMGKLCGKADIILPNLTEASFMLGIEYKDGNYDEEYIKDVLKKLVGLGCKKAVLTGVSFEKGKLGAMSYDSETNEYFKYFNTHLPVKFHGTGDVFASAFTGAYVRGISFENALKTAVDYTLETISLTLNEENHNWYGVNFEQATPCLINLLEKYGEK